MPIFGFEIPESCPGVDTKVLNPINTWEDKDLFKATATKLANKFIKNFERYQKEIPGHVVKAGPVLE